ncbi:MAG: VWA domain-containing protein [Oligoflexia bacterium]|nr:VWA domain-containing protein [Oligoflexia bacterium]
MFILLKYIYLLLFISLFELLLNLGFLNFNSNLSFASEETNSNVDSFKKHVQSNDFISAEESLKKITGKNTLDPFEGKYSLKDISETWKTLYEKMPHLKELETIANDDKQLEEKDYKELVTKTYGEIDSIIKSSNGKLNQDIINTLYRSIYDLSIIKGKTKFEIKDKKDKKDKKKKDGEEDDDKAVDGDQQDQDDNSPWEEESNQYKPRNKPFDSEGKKGNDKVLIETSAPLTSPLLGNNHFDVITDKRWSKAGVGRVQVYKDSKEKYSYRVHNYGQNNIPLPIPNGYRPVSTSPEIVITEKKKGEYVLVNNGGKPITELQIIKQELDANPNLESIIKKKYSLGTGIDKSKWPVEILDLIRNVEKETSDPLRQVKKIASYIRKNFNYYSKKLGKEKLEEADRLVREAQKSGDPDPVAFAKARTCQCDGAAWILSSLARDFLGIPARVVAGRTAVMRGNLAVIRKGDPRHAWIEVWVDGQGWIEVDATPPERDNKKDKKKDENTKDKSNDRPIGKKDKGEDEDNSKKDDGDKGEKEKKDDKKVDKKDDQKEDQNKDKEKENPKEETLMEQIEKDMSKNEGRYNIPVLLKTYLNERMKSVAEKVANPLKKVEEITKLLEELNTLGETYYSTRPIVQKIDQLMRKELNRIDEIKDLNMSKLFQLIQEKIDTQKIKEAYHLIRMINQDLEFLQSVRELSPSEKRYHQFINSLITKLQEMKHKDSDKFSMSDKFWKKLPGNISKTLIKEKYGEGVMTLGHPANIQLANDLESGKLLDFENLTKVSEFTKLLLQRSHKPQYEMIYFGKETAKKQKRPVVVTVKDITDLTRAILPLKPMDELMDDCINDKLYYYGYRRPIQKSNPVSTNEEILTIALVDESGSMNGARTTMAQTMIASFIDHARAENTSKLKHDVIVIPFSDDLGKLITVSSNQDAQKYLSDAVTNKLGIINGGTDIEKALIKAYEEIAKGFSEPKDKKDKKKVDLRRANIWLITDGGSPINAQRLKEAKSKIPPNVEINLNVVFVGDKNQELIDFLEKQNPDKPKFIKHIDDSKLNTLMSKTKEELSAKDSFATDKSSLQLDHLLLSGLRRIGDLGSSLEPLKENEYEQDKELQKLKSKINWDQSKNPPERNIELSILIEHLGKHKKELKEKGIYKGAIVKILKQTEDTLSKLNPIDYGNLMDFLKE